MRPARDLIVLSLCPLFALTLLDRWRKCASPHTWSQEVATLLCPHGPQHQKLSLSIGVKYKKLTASLIMAHTTRPTRFQTPPPEALASKEAITRRKCKFFDALARDRAVQSLYVAFRKNTAPIELDRIEFVRIEFK
jgi:hypothetical protein